MRKAVEPGSAGARIIAEEIELWARVATFLQGQRAAAGTGTALAPSHDAELIELRDAIAEAKAEDVAPLVEQMMRVSAVAAGRRGKTAAPVDIQAPYFGHLRLRPLDEHGEVKGKRSRDVLIGRQGLIDRAAGVQIVDWRDAPVSQIYYRYDEGDDYEETLSGGKLQGVIEARRNVTIQGGRLRRIGCPQGNFFCDPQGLWWQAENASLPALRGGQGQAARAPRPAPPLPSAKPAHPGHGSGRGKPVGELGVKLGIGPDRPALTERVDKHLPEIAALIDADQFALITEPQSELVVIQGGAGSGKTTVALHRVAYLAYQDPSRFRPRAMLVIVPSAALARYVAGVLPSLGVTGVPVQTSASWMRSQRKRLLPHLHDRKADHKNDRKDDADDQNASGAGTETPAAVSHLKKHPFMLQIIDRYIDDQAAGMRQSLAQAVAELPAGGADDSAGSDTAREEALVLHEWDLRADQPLRMRCRAVREAVGRLPLRREAALRLDDTLRRLSRRAHAVARDWAEILTDESRLRAGLRVGAAPSASGAPGGGNDSDDEVSRVTEQELRELLAWSKAQQEEVETLPEDVDPERYQAVDGRPLDEGSPAGRLDEEDDPLLLRIYQRKHGALSHSGGGGHPLRYEHLVLDEAQDLSAIEVRVLLSCVTGGGEYARPGNGPSVTIAGDVAQRLIFDNGFTGWEGLLRSVGLMEPRQNDNRIDNRTDKGTSKAVAIRHLKLLYRSTQQVMALAREVLGPLATDESEQQATRAGAAVSAFRFGETGEAVAFLGEALRSLLSREPTASVALISRHAGTGDLYYRGLAKSDVPALRRVSRHEFTFTPGVDVTDVTQVKGLEFDYVVILDATAGAYPDTLESRHLLHIAITRCAHQLWLIAAGPPSPLVPGHYFTGEPGWTEGDSSVAFLDPEPAIA